MNIPVKISSSLERIDPEQAAAILAGNSLNRSLSSGTVKAYASDMREGRWLVNGASIVLTDDGILLDGQHRLHAIIAAECAVAMLVTRGVSQGAFTTIDSGKGRSTGDVLHIEGYVNANAVAATASFALAYIEGGAVGMKKNSRARLLEFVENNPTLPTYVGETVKTRNIINNAAISSVLFLADRNRTRCDRTSEFIEVFNSGENLKKGDPRMTLREWCFNERARNRGRIDTRVAFSAVARAWNAFCKDDRLVLIKTTSAPSQDNTKIFGFRVP